MRPPDPGLAVSEPLQTALRLDQICDRFAAAQGAGQQPQIEWYLQGEKGREQALLLRDLLILELEDRLRRREHPRLEEYAARFPQHLPVLQDAFARTVPPDLSVAPPPVEPRPLVAPPNERERLAALRGYQVLDSDPEQCFDDLTFLAASICGTPMALVSLVDEDRQWFKSRVGVSMRETARNISFCTHTIQKPDLLLVPDALLDERFRNSPLVRSEPLIRFYAGAPMRDASGYAVGAVCVMDRKPRELNADQMAALSALSRIAIYLLDSRRKNLDLQAALASTGQHNRPGT